MQLKKEQKKCILLLPHSFPDVPHRVHADVHQALQHTATHCNTLQHTATHCNNHTVHIVEGKLISFQEIFYRDENHRDENHRDKNHRGENHRDENHRECKLMSF